MSNFDKLLVPIRAAARARFPGQTPRVWLVLSKKSARAIIVSSATKKIIESVSARTAELAIAELRKKIQPGIKKAGT